MPVATNSLIAFAAGCLLQAPSSQEPIPVAYPEKDALSPFRDPTDIYAPPDELFRQLGVMQNIADRPGVEKIVLPDRSLTLAEGSVRAQVVVVVEEGVTTEIEVLSGHVAQALTNKRH